MERHRVIQLILDTYQTSTSYLEIGVSSGTTFHAVKATHKVAVDPKFSFDIVSARLTNGDCRYHQETSDAYFLKSDKQQFDVIFIDGMHTFEQALRDLTNSLTRPRETGVIIIDDVIPNSFAAAISDISKMHAYKKEMSIQDGAWMGDVYKLIFFIADYLPAFSYATVAENHGQTLLWKQPRRIRSSVPLSISAITMLDFTDTVIGKNVFQLEDIHGIRDKLVNARNT